MNGPLVSYRKIQNSKIVFCLAASRDCVDQKDQGKEKPNELFFFVYEIIFLMTDQDTRRDSKTMILVLVLTALVSPSYLKLPAWILFESNPGLSVSLEPRGTDTLKTK